MVSCLVDLLSIVGRGQNATPEMLRESGLLALLLDEFGASVDAIQYILTIGVADSESNKRDEKRFHCG